MVMGAQLTAKVTASVPWQPLASVARTVDVVAGLLVGVPLSTPAELRVAHAGSDPLLTV
jgi:hypothetical protein